MIRAQIKFYAIIAILIALVLSQNGVDLTGLYEKAKSLLPNSSFNFDFKQLNLDNITKYFKSNNVDPNSFFNNIDQNNKLSK